jgi:hypothetical protein
MKKVSDHTTVEALVRTIGQEAQAALRAEDLPAEAKKAALAAVGKKLWQLGFELRDPAQGQLADPARRTYERLASLAASVDRDLAPAIAEAFSTAGDDATRSQLRAEEQAAIAAGRKRLYGPDGDQRQRLVDRYVKSLDPDGGRRRAVLEPDVPQWALGDLLVGLAALHPDVEVLVAKKDGAAPTWALRRGAVLTLR